MTNIETLIQMLHSVTEYDVVECGYDTDGNQCYAIRNLASKPSMIILGNMEINDFPQWLGKSKT